jgi:hypothetical protein
LLSPALADLRFLARVAARTAALVGALALGACSLPGSGSPTANVSPSPTELSGGNGTIAQDLTFTGKLPARWTSATTTCGQADGKGADSFSVKLTAADAFGQTDTLTIVVGSGYKGAGEYSVDTTTNLATAPPASTQIAVSTPQLVTNFVVLVDKTSGTIDSTMGHGADALDAIERVEGTWRCR